MIEFVKRLNKEQIMTFFYGVGTFEDIRPSASEEMVDIIFKEDCGKKFWYSISDDFISAYGFNKTSEDWKFYMHSIFGEEYLNKYQEEPVCNSFIEKLSIEDIKLLLTESRIIPYQIQEEDAFRKGTRRFKISIDIPIKDEIEVIIGPHIRFCEGIPSITEKMFMQFFSKKFGMSFISYYIDIEKKIQNDKIESYKSKCNRRVLEKLNYMVKAMENQ